MEKIDTVELRRLDEEATTTERAALRLKTWRALLEHIDAQAAESERLREQRDAACDWQRELQADNDRQYAELADVREQLAAAHVEIGDLTVELDEAQHPWRSFWRWLVALVCGRGCGWSWR